MFCSAHPASLLMTILKAEAARGEERMDRKRTGGVDGRCILNDWNMRTAVFQTSGMSKERTLKMRTGCDERISSSLYTAEGDNIVYFHR